jgi:hypothetical protein
LARQVLNQSLRTTIESVSKKWIDFLAQEALSKDQFTDSQLLEFVPFMWNNVEKHQGSQSHMKHEKVFSNSSVKS